jgi:hypothetical protein
VWLFLCRVAGPTPEWSLLAAAAAARVASSSMPSFQFQSRRSVDGARLPVPTHGSTTLVPAEESNNFADAWRGNAGLGKSGLGKSDFRTH